MFHLIEHLVQSPPEELRRIASPDLKAGDGAIRLSGSSHAETALAGRVDIHITDNVGVVEPLVVERSRKGVGGGGGLGKCSLLVGDGSLVETCGDAEDSEKSKN
mmetsp:Transcript_6515/g.11824  ORF Transcript_6515/g.11824 Transcript_6515/m.11824 type:complete len:104 (-) Transcript_6515:74-385(-)